MVSAPISLLIDVLSCSAGGGAGCREVVVIGTLGAAEGVTQLASIMW